MLKYSCKGGSLKNLKMFRLWQCSNPIDKTPIGGQGASNLIFLCYVLYLVTQNDDIIVRGGGQRVMIVIIIDENDDDSGRPLT